MSSSAILGVIGILKFIFGHESQQHFSLRLWPIFGLDNVPRREKKPCYPHPLPPQSNIRLFETLEHFSSIHFDEWILDFVSSQDKIVQVQVFAVNNPKVAWTILGNPNCLKPRSS
jgi:hypothetical protein